MFLSALDPDLLIYNYADWQNREPHCWDRFGALALHRRMSREYDQKIAISNQFCALICQSFPWGTGYRNITELRDLRQFVLEDLQKAHYLEAQAGKNVTLQPTGIVCQHVGEAEIYEAWEALLCGCVDEGTLTEFVLQVAAWDTPTVRAHSGPMILTVHDLDSDTETRHDLPIVWNEDSWATQLSTQDWWPDLQRCVELLFRTNPGLKGYPGVRAQPIPFECSSAFSGSLNHYCTTQYLRISFIEALTKKVYGVTDASLGDERIGTLSRFRVTRFWRVHYREESNRILLQEFGPHDIGKV